MMHVSLTILLLGLSYSVSPWATEDTGLWQARPELSLYQHRLYTRRQLRYQIEQWRVQAGQIQIHETELVLEETPDIVELEIMVSPHWREVSKSLLREMRRRSNRWEKVFIGRALLALLNLADMDELDRQVKLLVPAFFSVPGPIRTLAEPAVQLPAPQQNETDEFQAGNNEESSPSEAYLRALGQARLDAERRNAQDGQIMLINRSLAVLRRDFTVLMLKTVSRRAYRAVIEKLTRELRDRDAGFIQTIKALEEAPLGEWDTRLAKDTFKRLRGLAKRFGGSRQYTIYTEVERQQYRRSNFGQIELDFQEMIQVTLSKLNQPREGRYWSEPLAPGERAPGESLQPSGAVD